MKNTKVKILNQKSMSQEPMYFWPLIILVACFIAKLFFCTVSFSGDSLHCDMLADYWNFGKDLLKGKVLYKDLIDHKGPYLFFIYAFLSFISNNSVRIIVIFETLVYVLTVVAFYWYIKNIKKLNQDTNIFPLSETSIFALVYLLFTANVVLINTEGFSTICLILIWGILKKSQKVTPKMFFIIGIVLGILFNFKITSIAIYIPFFVYACVKHIKNNKEFKILSKSIVIGILGFIAINIPSLIYMLINNNLNDFIKIYNYACVGRNEYLILQIIVSLVFLMSGILYMFTDNETFVNLMFCLSSLILSWTFGNEFNYYVAFYVSIVFLELLQFKKTNKLIVWLILLVMVVFGVKEIKVNFAIDQSKNTKEIAMKYGITNNNILYLWEDIGYGVYSKDSFIVPYQWVPAGMFYSDEFTEYYIELTIERLKSKQFQYIYAPPLDTIESLKNNDSKNNDSNDTVFLVKSINIKYKVNMNKMFTEILPYLKEYYIDDLVDSKYLYKAK